MSGATLPLLLSGLFILAVSPLDYLRNEATTRHRQGMEQYRQQDYDAAAASFGAAQSEDTSAQELAFDAAAARYKAGDYEGALAALEGIRGAESAELQEQAHFNAGNALFKRSEFEQAIAAYDEALTLDPEDADAAFNKKLAEEALKRQQQEQQEQQEQQQEQSDDKSEESSSGGDGEETDQEQSSSDQEQQEEPGQGDKSQDEKQPNDGDQQSPGDQGQSEEQDDQQSQGGQSDPQDEGQQDGQQSPRQPFSNQAMPPPPPGRQYEPLNEAEVDRLLEQLERLEGSRRGQFNPNGELKPRDPFGSDPFGWFEDDPFGDPLSQDPFGRQFDDQQPSRSGRKDW